MLSLIHFIPNEFKKYTLIKKHTILNDLQWWNNNTICKETIHVWKLFTLLKNSFYLFKLNCKQSTILNKWCTLGWQYKNIINKKECISYCTKRSIKQIDEDFKKKSKSKDGICQFLQIYTETPNVQIGTVLERMIRDNRWPTTKKGLWLCKKFRHYKWLCNDPNGSNDCWYGNEQDIYGSILHNPTETSTLRPIWKCILLVYYK